MNNRGIIADWVAIWVLPNAYYYAKHLLKDTNCRCVIMLISNQEGLTWQKGRRNVETYPGTSGWLHSC